MNDRKPQGWAEWFEEFKARHKAPALPPPPKPHHDTERDDEEEPDDGD